MNDFSNTAKLLTVIADDEKGDCVLDVMRKAGVSGCTKLLGGICGKTEKSEPYESQCILLSLINSDPYKIINAISFAALQDCNLNVKVLLFNVFDFDTQTISCPQDIILSDTLKRSMEMEPKMKLIVTIINRIYTAELMSAARQAGAQGGTIIGARGTGTEEDAIFFGVRLAPEKEMLLILTKAEDAPQIVEAVKNQPIFNERGNGIVFSLNIEESFFFNGE